MANTWPKQSRVIGKKTPRLDGPEKATGRAKYSFDINRPGMLHAKILRCPYAHATLKVLDPTAAEKMPGVKAIHMIAKPGTEFYFVGAEVMALCADTEEHALDALRAIKVHYDEMPFVVLEEDGRKPGLNTTGGKGNIIGAGNETKGDVSGPFKQDTKVEGVYGIPVIAHQCLESHGLVAEWDADGNLTVWASTQAVAGPGVPGQLSGALKVPASKIRCITHHMGGGYGSKFGPGVEGIVAAELARKAKAPVKLMLDREEEVITGGTRPSAYGTVTIAGTKAGKITAFQADCYGSPGVGTASGVRFADLPYVYIDAIPNLKKDNIVVRLNTAGQRAWRAPGHPQSCIMTEWPIDDLAAAIGMDPMELRLKNLPPNDPKSGNTSWRGIRETLYTEQIKIAAKLSDWAKKWHPPGKGDGVIKHGIGMAIHTWGGAGRANNDVKVTISGDGSVLVECSTQDLGTGERTVLAIVVAEVLGLEPKDITSRIGESQYGRSTGSGGSTTCPGTAPAALNAAYAALDALLDKLAPRLKARREDLEIQPGKIVDKGSKKEYAWKEAIAKLGVEQVVGTGDWNQGFTGSTILGIPVTELIKDALKDRITTLSNNGVCGVQVAEVRVDTETGVVHCTKIVAVQDCGLLINKLGCESQVAGGVIMGLNPALWEERIMDRQTGRQVNPDMEFYKLGGMEDMPEIVVHMMDMPERGVIGIGEPPCISTCAAIGNAVMNAIGVRVPYAPFTPERVLAALAKKK